MKVICIDDSSWKGCDKFPVFGEIYTVKETTMSPHNGKPYYYHHLIEFDINLGFRVEKFAQISNISETAFERNYNKELV